jgi:phage tail-like protein
VPNLVLKRGMTESRDLWDWFAAYPERGEIAPKDGEVLLHNLEGEQRKIVRSWAFTAGYPVKWTGPELNALSPGVAFEALEIVHRGIRVRS